MDFFEIATSTPTMRRFLDRPIPEAELIKILETANMAPSGSNAIVAISSATSSEMRTLGA